MSLQIPVGLGREPYDTSHGRWRRCSPVRTDAPGRAPGPRPTRDAGQHGGPRGHFHTRQIIRQSAAHRRLVRVRHGHEEACTTVNRARGTVGQNRPLNWVDRRTSLVGESG